MNLGQYDIEGNFYMTRSLGWIQLSMMIIFIEIKIFIIMKQFNKF